MKNFRVEFVPYSSEFLNLSWEWLNDPEIKSLTMTPDFSYDDQISFFHGLPFRSDYKIFGIVVNEEKAGACGLKNIRHNEGELWCYLGLKKYWGLGLSAKILQFIEQESQKIGISILYLKVSKLNLRAISAYKKNGYTIIQEYPSYFMMSKDLTDVPHNRRSIRPCND